MSLTITIYFPRPIALPMGALVQIIGVPTGKDDVRAYQIIDGERGINYSAVPEDYTDDLPPYKGATDFTLPLIGRVTNCYQRGQGTGLGVYPSGHSLYDYNLMASDWVKAALPSYWQIIEEKREWSNAIRPRHSVYWERHEYRPEPLDATKAITRLQTAFREESGVDIRRTADALWQCSAKQCQAARHVERLKIIDNLRRHLYLEMKSDAHDFYLAETREEAALTAEAAIISLFSSLDILSHALAEIFCLGLSEREATFFNVLTVRPSIDSTTDGTVRKCLENDFTSHPLTQFLLQQRSQWIQELSEWRHHVVHHGCLNGGEYVDGGVILMKPKADDSLGQNLPSPVVASDLIGKWTSALHETLEATFKLLCDYLDILTEVRQAEEVEKVKEDRIAPPRNSSGMAIIESFLKLWMKSNNDEPKRIEHMFARLSSAWQREWGIDRFQNYIKSHPLLRFDWCGALSSGTDAEYGWQVSLQARLVFADKEELWHFVAVPTHKGKLFRLIRRPSSTLPSRVQRFTVDTFTSRQSGRETGHRDLVFSISIRNDSVEAVEEAEAFVFWHELSEAMFTLGTIQGGETRSFECIWKDGCVPIADLPALWTDRGQFRLRLTYKVKSELGDWWAEDYGPDRRP